MRCLIVLTVMLCAAGCASTTSQPLSSNATKALPGKSIRVVHRESPTFVAMTSNKGMFAVVGAAAAAGNKLVKDKQIPDPARQIGSALAEALADEHDMVLVEVAGGSDYVVAVATTGWSYMYDGFKFSDSYVGYTSKLRLIDAHTREVMSSGVCVYDAKQAGKGAVTQEALLQDDAAYIKSELSDAAAHCISQFRKELLETAAQTVAMQ